MTSKTILKKSLALSILFVSSLALSPTDGIAAELPTTKARTLSLGEGRVEFLAIGKPGFLKVKGEGAKPTGTLKIESGKATGEFSVDLSQFKTGIELRDEHMKEKYLEIAKHPKAVIRFSDVEVAESASIGTAKSLKKTVPAELELHGQKKPVSLETSLDGLKATATFKFKLTDFGISIPSYAGVTVAEEVTISIDSQMIESL